MWILYIFCLINSDGTKKAERTISSDERTGENAAPGTNENGKGNESSASSRG